MQLGIIEKLKECNAYIGKCFLCTALHKSCLTQLILFYYFDIHDHVMSCDVNVRVCTCICANTIVMYLYTCNVHVHVQMYMYIHVRATCTLYLAVPVQIMSCQTTSW